MKISIITATYNSGATVADTMRSVLHQSHKDIEYWIIDGGSKDNTIDVVKEYEPLFEGRLHWISERDRGIYDAMNKGLQRVTGDVVGILNSDDYYTSDDALQTIVDAFVQDETLEATYGDIHFINDGEPDKCVRYYSSEIFSPKLLRWGYMPAHPSFYCRKSTYERFKLDGTQIEGFKGDASCAYFNTSYKIAADFDFLVRTIYVGRIKTHYIQKNFVTMRSGGASNSGSSSHKLINADHQRTLRECHVYSNIFFLALRYVYKVGELAVGKIRRFA